jgi:protein gp37
VTKIEWTNETFNPVTGCYGPGGSAKQPNLCSYCYAERMARHRLAGRFGYPERPNHFKPTFHEDRLGQPLKWRKPRKVFVCSMADLFGEWVPDKWIQAVFDVVRATPQHTYQFLTKWPERLARWEWPGNAWVGATATNLKQLSRASFHLTHVKAPVRFVSCEPWLQRFPHRCEPEIFNSIDWLIVGQQTGPGANGYDSESVDRLIDFFDYESVPVFVKPPLYDQIPRQEWPREAATAQS